MLTQCLGCKLGKSLNSYVGYNFIEGNHLAVTAVAPDAPPAVAVAAEHTASSSATPFKGILSELPSRGSTSHLHSLWGRG